MGKFDEQLSRMSYLMEYRMPSKTVKTNIEYHANGADGKVYGILKEGTKYYIKTTESGKENIAESYDYINGFNNRKSNEYKSYNEATKHLELKLMSLNEAYGKSERVSTVDFNRGEKTMTMLTEEARKEIDRMKAIFENSNVIGAPIIGKDNEHGTATDPKAQGDPYGEKTEGSHEEGTSKTQSDPAKANKDYKDASKSVEAQMTSTDMPKGGTSKNDYKDTKDDLDGESVATKKPTGGKVVKVNESLYDTDDMIDTPMDQADLDEPYEFGDTTDHNEDTIIDDPVSAPETDMTDGIDPMSDLENGGEVELYDAETDGNEVGFGDGEPDYDSMNLDEMISLYENDCISGHEESMTGPTTEKPNNAIATWERVDECGEMPNAAEQVVSEDETQEAKQGGEETMTGPGSDNKNNAIATWERINESIDREVNRIMEKYSKPKKETLSEMVQRIVKEEVTRLDAWGKHPKFRKQPMTTPANKEVLAGTADRDWNDDSAKGEQPYGLKIGDGAPFNKTVEMLTDNVMSQLKESFLKKK